MCECGCGFCRHSPFQSQSTFNTAHSRAPARSHTIQSAVKIRICHLSCLSHCTDWMLSSLQFCWANPFPIPSVSLFAITNTQFHLNWVILSDCDPIFSLKWTSHLSRHATQKQKTTRGKGSQGLPAIISSGNLPLTPFSTEMERQATPVCVYAHSKSEIC